MTEKIDESTIAIAKAGMALAVYVHVLDDLEGLRIVLNKLGYDIEEYAAMMDKATDDVENETLEAVMESFIVDTLPFIVKAAGKIN